MNEVKPTAFNIDDGGSFDRLVEETSRLVENNGGTHAAAINLLQFRVVQAFVDRIQKDSMNEKLELKRKRNKNSIIIDDKEREESSKKAKYSGSGDNPEQKKKLKIVLKKKQVSQGKKKKPKDTKKKSINGVGINQIRRSFEKKGLIPPPKITSELVERIGEKGGSDIKLVIMKEICATDLNKHHGRLSIPENQIEDKLFLTEEEKKRLEDKKQIRVMVMEPCGDESSMVFIKWQLRSSDTYALRTGWNGVLRRNHEEVKHFKLEDVIQIWSFRVGTQLWFAIDKVYDAPSTSSSSSVPCSSSSAEDQSIVEIN